MYSCRSVVSAFRSVRRQDNLSSAYRSRPVRYSAKEKLQRDSIDKDAKLAIDDHVVKLHVHPLPVRLSD